VKHQRMCRAHHTAWHELQRMGVGGQAGTWPGSRGTWHGLLTDGHRPSLGLAVQGNGDSSPAKKKVVSSRWRASYRDWRSASGEQFITRAASATGS